MFGASCSYKYLKRENKKFRLLIIEILEIKLRKKLFS